MLFRTVDDAYLKHEANECGFLLSNAMSEAEAQLQSGEGGLEAGDVVVERGGTAVLILTPSVLFNSERILSSNFVRVGTDTQHSFNGRWVFLRNCSSPQFLSNHCQNRMDFRELYLTYALLD